MILRVASANVNGIRAAQRRGFDTWLADRRPDIVGIQEMRCTPAQVPDGLFDGYHVSSTPADWRDATGSPC